MKLLRRFVVVVMPALFVASSASAFVMRGPDGPEPMFVEVKRSVRLSPDFDAHLATLAAVEASLGLHVISRHVGPRYLELVGFPPTFTRENAVDASNQIRALSFIEQVVPASASNLVWRAGDFGTRYAPNDIIPEAARRGLEGEPAPPINPEIVNSPHAPNQLIVAWKPEFIWNAEQTGFVAKIAAFNAAAGCRVVSEYRPSATELTQVLTWSGPDALLLEKLQLYTASGWVKYAQPNFRQSSFGGDSPGVVALAQPTSTPARKQSRIRLLRPHARPFVVEQVD